MSGYQVWRTPSLHKMTGALYDSTIANPWFGAQPALQDNHKPTLLAFMVKPAPGFPENAENLHLMKTLHLLQEDFSDSFNFAYVDFHDAQEWTEHQIGRVMGVGFAPTVFLI